VIETDSETSSVAPAPKPPSSPVGGLRALLTTQFLGAFNDNAFRLFVIVLAGKALTAAGVEGSEFETETQRQTMLAFVVFTVPLMLFSLPAGTLADRVSKRTLILVAKGLELLLMAAGTAVLASGVEGIMWPLVVLGGMGIQSALFAPVKYGIVPELVPHERLSAANGALEMWTFLAIISGAALGPLLLDSSGSEMWIAGAVLSGLALAGFLAARGIPKVPAVRTDGGGLTRTVSEAWSAMTGDRSLWLAVLGMTWFWAIASLLGQDLLVYSRSVLGLSDAATGIPLAVFGLGVGFGSFLAGKVSEEKVELGLIPMGAMGLGVFTLVLGLAAPGLTMTLVLMTLLGAASGFLIVPLDALLQWRSPADRRGSIIALSNVFVFGGMLVGSLAGWLMATADISARGILIGAAIFTLAGTAWALKLLPEAMLRFCAFLFTHFVYKVRVTGVSNVPRTGGALLTPNHVSFVDGLFLVATLDRPVRFIIDREQFERPFMKPFLKIMQAIPISATGGTRDVLRALKDAGQALDDGEIVCIFPEGQITRTGGMLPFRRGLERIAKGRDAPIVPVHLDRLWGSIFSFSGGRVLRKLPRQLPYPVSVSFGTPLPANATPISIRAAVAALGEQAWYARKDARKPLHHPFLSLARRRPWALAMADVTRPKVTRLTAAAGAVALARALRETWADDERVGLLLPSSVGAAIANIAVSVSGRTSVNLNFTAGIAGMQSAMAQSGLTSVVTSRAFLEKLELELPADLEVVYLEDVAKGIGGSARLAAALGVLLLPHTWLERWCGARRPIEMDDVATIIFSSGSTGEPKGVMLSHFNVDSNVDAVSQVFRLHREDALLGILPTFHSFGYMSLWFALDSGMPVVFHPNPTDAAVIGRLVHRYELTLLLATPTFLQMYLRRCTPDEFGSLRIVLTGAEKLPEKLANDFEERFGIRPLEGYGATECSPVIATSIPSFRAPGFFQPGSRRGSVGPPVPGMAVRIEHPETGEPCDLGKPGLLKVRGPNVMQGYLGREDLTNKVLVDGWYDTGDIAIQDEDGFLRITDRLSRFSKIGGEMVPHGRVEEALHEAHKGDGPRFAVTAVPDERKGERLAVLTTVGEDDIPAVLEGLGTMGLPNLFLPRRDSFVFVDEIPVLGTGKTDLRAIKTAAKEALL